MSPSATQIPPKTALLTKVRREHMYNKIPRTNVTKEMVMDMAKEQAVEFVDLQFTDIYGVLKAVTIPVYKLSDAIDNNVWFDGSSISGFSRVIESDMYLKLDLNTFAVLPWTKNGEDVTARLICDVFMPDGTPFEGDPRGILKRQLKEAKKLGFKFNTGPELEFFLFKTDENGDPMYTTNDNAGYFDLAVDKAHAVRRHMAFALDEMGMEVESLHHEVAEGQHEICFKYADALTTADNAITLKLTLKSIAKMYGLHATFMPKPIFGVSGSGMHVHQSLQGIEDGENKFYDPEGTYGMSKIAKSFIAGQIKHIQAVNALTNPTINSYKRLVVGYEAPVNAAWGQHNRSALIRVPRVTPSQTKHAARCELRCPDPSSNPYLAFAAMLAAGLDGIKNEMVAPEPIEDNIWHLTPTQMKEKGVQMVAPTLKDALKAFRDDEVIRGAMGEHFFNEFYNGKMKECDEFRTSVSEWELDRYLHC